jgi:cell division control protein 11
MSYGLAWFLSIDSICKPSSHLGDLKSLTHDVLYETYRTEKLSRTVHSDTQYVPSVSIICSSVNGLSSDSSILPEELANQSVRLKEEQLRREEEKVCSTYLVCDPHC